MWRDPYGGGGLGQRFFAALSGLLVAVVGLRVLAGLLEPLVMPLLLAVLVCGLLLWFFRRPFL